MGPPSQRTEGTDSNRIMHWLNLLLSPMSFTTAPSLSNRARMDVIFLATPKVFYQHISTYSRMYTNYCTLLSFRNTPNEDFQETAGQLQDRGDMKKHTVNCNIWLWIDCS